MSTDSFLTLHSPRGACAHFALGCYGRGGGFGLQADRAASQDVFIGLRRGTQILCLPFFHSAQSSDGAAALSGFLGEHARPAPASLAAFSPEEVQRTFGWGTDTWQAPGIGFTIYTPVTGIPDPAGTSAAALQDAIIPALAARLTIDNRGSRQPLQGFFAVSGMRGLRWLAGETGGALTGWASVHGYGFACEAAANPRVRAVSHFELPSLFAPPHPLPFPLAGIGALLVEAGPGECVTLDFALGWHRRGQVTEGLHACQYAYSLRHNSLEDVLRCAVARLPGWRAEAEAADRELAASRLNADQQFCLAQATRSYWASSMLFAPASGPTSAGEAGAFRWVVNEGSFMMLNTFDLAVDHVFFELRQQPWVVKNVLDAFADDYSYFDRLHFPGEAAAHPGGIAFTHDHGSFHTFTPRGTSSYEVSGQPGCFSYMSHEQLINWVLCAGLYVHASGDRAWAAARRGVIEACLDSMLHRDHPDPAQRDGVMDLDSSRAYPAEEITTYDSLDPSLGQARRNLYLAVKGWAASLGLERLFGLLGDPRRAQFARQAAERAAITIEAAYDPGLGYIPAILGSDDPSPIIPAIEGLIFPYRMGLEQAVTADGPFGGMIARLRLHLEHVLKPGLCQFPDGSWKLSARSDNSWISKVFLCQHIARKILGLNFGPEGAQHDRVHADWWRVGSAENPGIDQIFAGRTTEVGFYYPRAVTSILWLEE